SHALTAIRPGQTLSVEKDITIELPEGFVFEGDLSGVNIDFSGLTVNANLIPGNGMAFLLQSPFKATTSLAASSSPGDTEITLASADHIETGDIIRLVSTELFNTQRPEFFVTELCVVKNVSGDSVEVESPIRYSYNTSQFDVAAHPFYPINNF